MKKVLLSVVIALIIIGAVGIGYFYSTYKAISIPSNNSGQITDGTSTTTDTDTSGGTIGTTTTTRPGTNPLPFVLPKGFSMSIFSKGVTNARVMTFDPKGVMLVSEPSEGKIVALPDVNGDSKADGVIVVADKLNKPHGMAFRCGGDTQSASSSSVSTSTCKLYVGETNQLSVFDYDSQTKKASNKKKLLDLPSGGYNQHFTRTLLFMPSPNGNILLISVGSSCNVCVETDTKRASVIAYDVATAKAETFAKGLRNSVFMTIHPVTGAIWATEMGRDGLGDNIPPDEINIFEKGKNYGWPNCYGQNIHDTSFDKNTYIRNPCMAPFELPPVVDLQAHSAPLGISFIGEEGWPEEYWHNALVAYHGSWNRSVPTGYKVVRIKLSAKGAVASSTTAVEDFITGWLRPDGSKIGRPADVKVMPGGTIYISDDVAGVIYVVRKSGSPVR